MPEEEAETAQQRPISNRAPWWLWPNILALDAPIVAVSWLFLFARAFQTSIFAHTYWILGLAVWLIYTADHLWDGHRLKNRESATARHRFAADFARPLGAAWLIAAAVLAYLLLFKAEEVMVFSLTPVFLTAFVSAYFVGRLFMGREFPKEVLCGTIFALGVLCPVSSLSNWLHWSDFVRPEIWLFALLCSVNCIAISWWEVEADRDNDPDSAHRLSRHRPWPQLAIFIGIVSLIIFALSFPGSKASVMGALSSHPRLLQIRPFLDSTGPWVAAAIATSAFLLFALSKSGPRFSTPLKRVLADAVLLTPWIFVWMVD